MPLGFYRGNDERLVSVTSWIDYIFGIADEIDKWTIKQSILAVQKASKTQKLTQDLAIKIGLEARSLKLDSARIRGTQVHQAIQNLHNNLPYEFADPEDAKYYASYFNFYTEHQIEPILEEFKVENYQYGYAGRLDFYGKMDGKLVLLDFKTSKSVRWTYGLQLACYRKCLEDLGYQIDACYVVHIKPKSRGSIPRAELFEFKYPFEAVKWALGLFHLKLAHDPYVQWYERTDEGAVNAERLAIEAEKKEQAAIKPELARVSSSQGSEKQDISPMYVEPGIRAYRPIYHLDTSSPSLVAAESLLAGVHTQNFDSSSQPEVQAGESALQLRESPTNIPLDAGVVVSFVDKNQRPLKTTKHLSAKSILRGLRPDEEELDSQQLRRRGIAV